MVFSTWRRAAAALGASLALFACAGLAGAQVITTVSGNGTAERSGDGGPALAAGHGWVTGMARDGLGNIYVVEYYDFRIRKIAPDGTITNFAGNGQPVFVHDAETNVGDGGPATAAAITPFAIAADAVGNVYFTDQRHHRVRKVTPAGIISTLAGRGDYGFTGDGGQATLARLADMHGIAVDGGGNVYISVGHAIRKIAANGIITRIAGSGTDWSDAGDGGPAINAYLRDPAGLAVDAAGNVYVADSGNHRVRRITPGGTISTIMGGGRESYWTFDFDATRVGIGEPLDVAVDSKGYVYALSSDSWVRKVSPEGLLANGGGFRCPHDGCGISALPPLVEGGDAFQAYLLGGSSIDIEPGDSLLIANVRYGVRRIGATPPAQPPLATDVLKPFESYAVDSTADAVATGDFDGDGRADVVVATRLGFSAKPDDFKVLLYRQQPNGTLASPAKSLPAGTTGGLLLVDLDHDGRRDIVVTRAQGLAVFLGNAGGQLNAQMVDVPKMEAAYRATSTDIDGDGHVDVIVLARHADLVGQGFWIFRGTGTGNFLAPQFLQHQQNFSWWPPNELRMGDLNGDGRDDLLVGGTNGTPGIYFHDGGSSLRVGVPLLPANLPHAFSAGDADDDGRDDILAVRRWQVPTLYFYRQDANGRLDAPRLFGLERGAEQSLLADMNNDGRSDLLLLDGGWGLSYLQRTATGYHFPRKYFVAKYANAPQHPESLAVGRLDGDECLDVATISDAGGLMVYRGQNCQALGATRDVDADGRDDVAWVGARAGVQLWPGADRSKSVALRPAPGWGLAAMADFGGDGRADLLWRNCVNGALMRWDGLRAPARPATSAGPDRAWRLAATADFDGNGRADLLWRHVSGATERWPDGDRARRRRGATLQAGWSVVASGDFDGDGRADVFWRHAPTGANLVWRAGGLAGALRVTAITDRGWQVAGAGDADGDGRADLFWRHRLDGRNALWPAAQYGARRALQALPDPGWVVAAMQDVDGDRRADVLWQHASGLGLLWKRADPELAFPAAATPRGWQPFERGFDGCSLPAAAAGSAPRPVGPARRGRD